MRACPDCGEPESRRKDEQGRWLLNLDPVSGKCIKCLAGSVRAKPMPVVQEYDWAKKAAGDDD